MRIFSYGGGVQSTAALVLAAQGILAVDAFVFADVGEDSEHPDTVAYVREVARPYAAAQGVLFHTVRHLYQGQPETLLQHLYRPRAKGIPIPARLNGGAPVRRLCTTDWKIRPINGWLLRQDKHGPHVVCLGISLDEMQRMTNRQDDPRISREYPLIARRMTRADCVAVIEAAGLQVPPKSSCWFCPYHSLSAWAQLRDTRPDLFAAAGRLEQQLTARVAHRGNHAYLTDANKPLAEAVGTAKQLDLFGYDSCDSGYCFT